MQCPRCRTDNRESRRFCSKCGGPLALACASCGFINEPDDAFCGGCSAPLRSPPTAPPPTLTPPESYTPRHLAEKILTSKASLEGERKQVTVLFVDVAGFTSISESLDPEDVHAFMTRAFELMLAEVHRYEGTVNQFLGDGLMALFGAPVAHEDHARRAAHAALGIRQSLDAYRDELGRAKGVTFRIRQGLNTGLVVVGSIGDDLRMDYTAVGDTTNLAARLQQAAEPGGIVVSEATHRLISGYFDTLAIPDLSLKGKAAPVHAWALVSAREGRTRLEVAVDRGLTPFVGRDRELALVLECAERAKAGHGQVVFIGGEPGIGKSRLLLEVKRRLGEDVPWRDGHAVSFGRALAFHPVIDLVKRNFRVEERDTEPVIVEKLERAVLELGEDLRAVLPFVRYLLSVGPGDPAVLGLDPKQRRAEIFHALRLLILRAAETTVQVLLFENLHWVDQASEDFVAFVADSIPTSRVLLLLTYRPGYVHRLGDRTYHTRIMLDALSADDSNRMTRGILAAEDLPEGLNALVARKAEGNPFFVEEIIRSLREAGEIRRDDDRYVLARRLDEIFIPDSVQDVIMARIDRLEEAAKTTLQRAAVIGQEFTHRLLDRLADVREQTDPLVQRLKAVELIYEKSVFPELAYMFKHALTHDVAYTSLLVRRRKELHRLVGLAIEDLYRDRLGEHYGVLAHHFTCGEEWPKALDYLIKAAEQAAKAFATREALTLYDEALGVSAHLGMAVDPATVMAIHQAKCTLFFVVSDFELSRAEGERLLEIARRVGDRARESGALAAIAWASMWSRDLDEALASASRAIDVAAEVDAKPVLARSHFTIGFVQAVTGRLGPAASEIDRALAISRSGQDAVHQSLSLSVAGLLKNWEGEYGIASSLQSQALDMAREHNLLVPLLFAFFLHGLTLTGNGRYDQALATFEEGLALAEKVGDEAIHHRILNCLGWLHLELGDLERATELNERSAEVGRRRRDPGTLPNAEINLGDLALARGDLALAHDLLDGVRRHAQDPATSEWMRFRYSIRLFASLGELSLARGDLGKARGFAEQCLELATRTNAQRNLVKGWRLAGEVARAQRRWEDATRALDTALGLAQTIGNPPQIWKTHLALGRLHVDRKDHAAADGAYRAARVVIDRVRAGLRDVRLRSSFERGPWFEELDQAGNFTA
jgi:class 3 adenylate cyclase/tetratricopeptide (TPR) repeat protein